MSNSRKAKAWEKHAPESPRTATGNIAAEQTSISAATPHFSETGEIAEVEDLKFTAVWTEREIKGTADTDAESEAFPAEEMRSAKLAGYDAVARAMEAADAAGREAEIQVARAVPEVDQSVEAGQQKTEDADERFAEE